MSAYLIIWNQLNSDGSVSKAEEQRIVRTLEEARRQIGKLKGSVETWRAGFHCVVGPEDKVLTSRGTNLEVFELPRADFDPENIPPGWEPGEKL